MKTKKSYLSLALTSILLMVSQLSASQTFTADPDGSVLKVEGTSNIHDWEITAENFRGDLKAQVNHGQPILIEGLRFVVLAESLKSGKGGMDKNTYKALQTEQHPQITYQLDKVTKTTCSDTNTCKIQTSGFLTVAGVKKPVEISFDVKEENGKLILSGNKKIKMTDYKIDPPTAMFGTITTGDEVKVNFKVAFVK